MFEDWETILRFSNGLFTVLLATLLYNIYRKKNKRFYLLWSLGYLLYGLNIFVRIFVTPPWIYPIFFIIAGFAMILIGIGTLVNRTRDMIIVSAAIPVAVISVMLLPNATLNVWLISLLPYLLTAGGLLLIRRNGAAELDMLIIGWFILLMINIALAFNMMTPIYVEIMAIFAKTVIYGGMVGPKFPMLAEDLKRFLISGEATTYINGEPRDRFLLLAAPTNQKQKEVDWIAERVEKNSAKGIRTVIVSVYDVLTMADLRARNVNEENIYIVKIITGGRTNVKVFEEHILNLNDDVSLLELLFADITNYSKEKKVKCEIIIYSLSHLIHTHGSKRVYSFIISKIPVINAGNISLVCIYYPDTHEKVADRSIFESLAERVTSI